MRNVSRHNSLFYSALVPLINFFLPVIDYLVWVVFVQDNLAYKWVLMLYIRHYRSSKRKRVSDLLIIAIIAIIALRFKIKKSQSHRSLNKCNSGNTVENST